MTLPMRAYTLADKLMAAAKQAERPLCGAWDGIAVHLGAGEVAIECPFNIRLNDIARAIPGFRFHHESKFWVGPLEEYDAIADAIARMRLVARQCQRARTDIEAKARDLRPQAKVVDAFAAAGRASHGPIIASNALYRAQETTSGAILIHEAARLDRATRDGASARITYQRGGKSATVEDC